MMARSNLSDEKVKKRFFRDSDDAENDLSVLLFFFPPTFMWQADLFAAFKKMFFETLKLNLTKHVVPGDILTSDDTLYPMRVQV